MLKIQVLFFAQLKEQTGCSTMEKQLPETATPGDLIRDMQLRGPVLCAVNEQQVDTDYPLKYGDVVALMPPMSGG